MRQDAVIEVADRGKTRQETQPSRNQKADTFDQGTDGDSDSRHGARRQRLSVTSPLRPIITCAADGLRATLKPMRSRIASIWLAPSPMNAEPTVRRLRSRRSARAIDTAPSERGPLGDCLAAIEMLIELSRQRT